MISPPNWHNREWVMEQQLKGWMGRPNQPITEKLEISANRMPHWGTSSTLLNWDILVAWYPKCWHCKPIQPIRGQEQKHTNIVNAYILIFYIQGHMDKKNKNKMVVKMLEDGKPVGVSK